MIFQQLERAANAIVLGSGSLGQVELMRDRQSGIPFAVKKITNRTIIERDLYWCLRDDIADNSKLRHRNLIKLLGVFFDHDAIYIIEEYAPHGDLQRKLAGSGRIDENIAKIYVRQLIEVLTFCHHNSIKHREITPKNILIGYNGHLKLSVVGFITRGTTESDKKIGTCGYTPPEVYDEQGVIIHEFMDSFSIGIIIFMMLIGRHPFLHGVSPGGPEGGEDEEEVVRRMRQRQFSIPDDMDRVTRNLIDRLLMPNPDARQKFGTLMQHPWVRRSESI